jgi:AcrR family transcriptional regulator
LRLTKKKITPRKEPNQERAKETVETIVAATAHILEKDGFENISTNKIAEKAGVSIGSLYQYFPTKDAIFNFMMERYVKSQTSLIDGLLENRDTSMELRSTIGLIISAILETKRKQAKFNKLFVQKLMSFTAYEALNRQDEHLIALFKRHLEPHRREIRTDNLELQLYFVIQAVKMLPTALLFQDRFNFRDKAVDEELTELVYSYLRKNA